MARSLREFELLVFHFLRERTWNCVILLCVHWSPRDGEGNISDYIQVNGRLVNVKPWKLYPKIGFMRQSGPFRTFQLDFTPPPLGASPIDRSEPFRETGSQRRNRDLESRSIPGDNALMWSRQENFFEQAEYFDSMPFSFGEYRKVPSIDENTFRPLYISTFKGLPRLGGLPNILPRQASQHYRQTDKNRSPTKLREPFAGKWERTKPRQCITGRTERSSTTPTKSL